MARDMKQRRERTGKECNYAMAGDMPKGAGLVWGLSFISVWFVSKGRSTRYAPQFDLKINKIEIKLKSNSRDLQIEWN